MSSPDRRAESPTRRLSRPLISALTATAIALGASQGPSGIDRRPTALELPAILPTIPPEFLTIQERAAVSVSDPRHQFPNYRLRQGGLVSCGEDGVAMGGFNSIVFGKIGPDGTMTSYTRELPFNNDFAHSMRYDPVGKRIIYTTISSDESNNLIYMVPMDPEGAIEVIDPVALGFREADQVLTLANGNLVIAGPMRAPDYDQHHPAHPILAASKVAITDPKGAMLGEAKQPPVMHDNGINYFAGFSALVPIDAGRALAVSAHGGRNITKIVLNADMTGIARTEDRITLGRGISHGSLEFISASPHDPSLLYYSDRDSSAVLVVYVAGNQPTLVSTITGFPDAATIGVSGITGSDGNVLDALVSYDRWWGGSSDPVPGSPMVTTASLRSGEMVGTRARNPLSAQISNILGVSADGRWVYRQPRDSDEGQLVNLNLAVHERFNATLPALGGRPQSTTPREAPPLLP